TASAPGRCAQRAAPWIVRPRGRVLLRGGRGSRGGVGRREQLRTSEPEVAACLRTGSGAAHRPLRFGGHLRRSAVQHREGLPRGPRVRRCRPGRGAPVVSARRDRLGPMAAKKTLVPWNSAKPAPVVMIYGGESVLVRMAKDRIVSTVRKQDPEEIEFDAAGYQAGELAMATSPSLFSTAKLIVVVAVEKCSEDFLNDALAYLDDPNDDDELRGGEQGR